MPRTARKKSKTGIYHVMFRGNNRQKIFLCRNDKLKFCDIIKDNKEKSDFEVYAYCLMDNHVHLLIKENRQSISEIIKKITGKYALWFNKKNERAGHLFQGRFRSIGVEDEQYFLTVLHYIIQNPIKSGECQDIEEYEFSSAREYCSDTIGITDVAYALQFLEKKDLILYLKSEKEDPICDIEGRMTDAEAKEIIKKEMGEISFEQLFSMKRYQLENLISKIRAWGVPLRQISRITGLGIGRIRNM